MEKRTIIAFVLSFLILIIWSYVYNPVPQKRSAPVERKEAQREAVPLEPSPPEAGVPPAAVPEGEKPSTAPAPVIMEEEKEIRVETPLYSALFSNAGATIKSFKLKKYRLKTDPDSPLVELVALENRLDNFLEVRFAGPSSPRQERIFYHADQDAINLEPESPPQDLVFTATTPEGLSVNQVFRIYPDRYPIDLTVKLANNTGKQIDGNVQASIKNMPPQEKSSYYAFLGIALLLDNKLEEIETKKMKEGKNLSGRIEWMAYESGHFMSAIIPENPDGGSFTGRVLPSGVVQGSYKTPFIPLGPHGRSLSRFTLYMGPREVSVLKQMDKKLDLALNFGWTDIIAKPLLYTLRFFNRYFHNYGLSIILLTVLIKILFWPLTHKSYKSMKEMQKLQPHMAKLREKYKDNKEQLNKELMGLYKTYKVNPMGGCLPMIIQIPVFFALFRILGNSIELRHAPLIFWINDLSAPDRLFNFPFQIPFMSPPYGIPVLTLLMGASMFVQQKMTPTPGDPTQAKIMMFLPLIFTVMFINFPSGLVLYWLVNNILSIGQQYRIIKSSA
jgi:YidC/Oxa1 family membrane protein insertase